jgi:hypothetical protein
MDSQKFVVAFPEGTTEVPFTASGRLLFALVTGKRVLLQWWDSVLVRCTATPESFTAVREKTWGLTYWDFPSVKLECARATPYFFRGFEL